MCARKYLLFIILAFSISACSSYRQHIMFKTEEGFSGHVKQEKELAERNYRIQVNDRLDIRVFTNEGERIIDPDFELQKDLGNNNLRRETGFYFLNHEGRIKLPLVGEVELEGMTLREAEAFLEEQYHNYYKDPYVVLQFLNKRVIVMGSLGGQVIPLENENMNLIEVLALAGGVEEETKVQNIRLIRGDLVDPEVYLIDLSTIEGLKQAELEVYSGDIIYVEPVVRVVTESTRDLAPLISIMTSTIALIIAILSFSTN